MKNIQNQIVHASQGVIFPYVEFPYVEFPYFVLIRKIYYDKFQSIGTSSRFSRMSLIVLK